MTAAEPRHWTSGERQGSPGGERWPGAEHEELFATFASLRTPQEAQAFLRDLCTRSELDAMAHRWQVARLLDEGLPYLEVARRAHASTTTVTRVAQWLRNGEGGYARALRRWRRQQARRSPTGSRIAGSAGTGTGTGTDA